MVTEAVAANFTVDTSVSIRGTASGGNATRKGVAPKKAWVIKSKVQPEAATSDMHTIIEANPRLPCVAEAHIVPGIVPGVASVVEDSQQAPLLRYHSGVDQHITVSSNDGTQD